MAAARRELHVEAQNIALTVEADFIVGAEVMALAGHRHVAVAVEPDLAGALRDVRGERGHRRPLRRLALLAAEGAAHAPHFDGHGCLPNVEKVRHDMLHLARVLC
jgi:hypothetical protein